MTSVINNNCKLYFRSSSRYSKRLANYANEDLSAHTSPDLDELTEKEWKEHVVKLAEANIRPKLTEQEDACFSKILKAVPVEQIAEELDIKKNTVYVIRQRLLEKLNREIRFLNEELG